jgi:hypothetical protein
VFLGSATAAQACNELEERNITHIISVNHSPDYIPFYPKVDFQYHHKNTNYFILHSQQFEYLVVLAEDDLYQEMLSIMLDCFAFIDECLAKNRRILIHWYVTLFFPILYYSPSPLSFSSLSPLFPILLDISLF